jgi:hypothetical protein
MMTTRSTRSVFAATLSLSLLATAAYAGPPMLCHALDTGGAPSLPWRGENGWKGSRADYDRARLIPDTLALLGADVPVIARMETLRRAALYAVDSGQGAALLKALEARAQKAAGADHALAQFDLGYGTATVAQAGALAGGRWEIPPAAYGHIQYALRERGTDPAMEYAAALVNLDRVHRDLADAHLQRAVAGAPAGSPLARTLAAHAGMWGAAMERARASVAQK